MQWLVFPRDSDIPDTFPRKGRCSGRVRYRFVSIRSASAELLKSVLPCAQPSIPVASLQMFLTSPSVTQGCKMQLQCCLCSWGAAFPEPAGWEPQGHMGIQPFVMIVASAWSKAETKWELKFIKCWMSQKTQVSS